MIKPTISAAGAGSKSRQLNRPAFRGAHYSWPFDRQTRPFVVRIVEPRQYGPSNHNDLFYAVMENLLQLTGEELDSFSPADANRDRWDLVTFPEAFVTSEALLTVCDVLGQYGPSGCIHVGLRPDDTEPHLFNVRQLSKLITDLTDGSAKRVEDLRPFKGWLDAQEKEKHFNVGCLFMVDADGDTRICLHPKLVRSQQEASALAESHLAEADLLTLVTLFPTDPRYLTVTIQPLLCSDALDLPTDRPYGGPLTALARHADCFDEAIPDHVDIVSVAVCTPQKTLSSSTSAALHRDWHEKFRNMFLAVAENSDYSRHHFSVVMLANFQEIGSSPAGLSGLFLPVAPRWESLPQGFEVTCWGRLKSAHSGNNRWSLPDDKALVDWENRGSITCLTPSRSVGDEVRMFRCTIQRLPRETSLWTTSDGLTNCDIVVGRRDGTGALNFERMPANVRV